MGRAFAGSGRFARAFKLPLLFHFSSVLLLSDDRYVNRRFADFRPGFSPHRPNNVQCSPSDIDATRRSNERSQCSNMHFPENCKSDSCVSRALVAVCVCPREIRPGRRIVFFFKRKSQWLRIRVSLTNTRL